MTAETMPDWALIEAAKRCGWWSHPIAVLRERYDELNHRTYRALCDMVLQHEQPPVDRKVLCAREAMAREAEATTTAKWAAKFRSGEYDETDHITVPLRAIELYEDGFGQ